MLWETIQTFFETRKIRAPEPAALWAATVRASFPMHRRSHHRSLVPDQHRRQRHQRRTWQHSWLLQGSLAAPKQSHETKWNTMDDNQKRLQAKRHRLLRLRSKIKTYQHSLKMQSLMLTSFQDPPWAFCSNSKIRLKSGKPCTSASIVSGEEILFFNKLALHSENNVVTRFRKFLESIFGTSFQHLTQSPFKFPCQNCFVTQWHSAIIPIFSLCVQPSSCQSLEFLCFFLHLSNFFKDSLGCRDPCICSSCRSDHG